MEAVPPGASIDPADKRVESELLAAVFGAYKDEWLDKDVFGYFEEPQYWPDLSGRRPCVLEGGRGTGKTTVLRGMSYQGQFARAEHNIGSVGEWKYFGLYHKIDAGRVTAMRGEELEEEQWIRLFSHYLNLILCDSLCGLLAWLEQHGIAVDLPAASCTAVAATLNLEPLASHQALAGAIRESLDHFESYVNNVADGGGPRLSMRGAPVERLIDSLREQTFFADRSFVFLVDEYENLEPYQQRVVNTLVKHTKPGWSWKIGVRELGWKDTSTLAASEWLEDPADYRRIPITSRFDDAAFRTFAAQVCSKRLQRLWSELAAAGREPRGGPDLERLLPGLSDEEEALALGVEKQILEVEPVLGRVARKLEMEAPTRPSPLTQYLILHWSETHPDEGGLDAVVEDYLRNPEKWSGRQVNYGRQALFSVREGLSGIRKYYAGWEVLCRLAGSNIRYLLQLVEQSILKGIVAGGELGDPVEPRWQTVAAFEIAEKNLRQLEGRSSEGAQLQRLALGLGRIFGELAARGARGAPEVDQFELGEERLSATEEDRLERLLREAIMTLALVRERSNKSQSPLEVKGDLYSLHPIFSAFFTFTYRRKRKMKLAPSVLLGLIDEPRRTLAPLIGDDPEDDSEHRGTAVEIAQIAIFEDD